MHNDHRRIVAADILPTGLLVTFDDERAALFSNEHLQRIRVAAEQLLEAELLDAATRNPQDDLVAGRN